MRKLGKLRCKVLARQNQKAAQRMALISACSDELEHQKNKLKDQGLLSTWEQFSQTAEYSEIFNGINQQTIDAAQQIWEAI